MAHALVSAAKNTIHASFSYTGDDVRIMLCGLGGQGIALAADICTLVAAESGADVSTQNIHGMAQRGESVMSLISYGKSAPALGAAAGSQDFIVAFETTEALRYHSCLKPGGTLITNDIAEAPITTFVGNDTMPPKPRKILKQLGAWVVAAQDQASLAGSSKAQNVLLLGVLAQCLPFEKDLWQEIIKRVVDPHFVEINLTAFERGYTLTRR